MTTITTPTTAFAATQEFSNLRDAHAIHTELQEYQPPQDAHTIPLHSQADAAEVLDMCKAMYHAYLVRGFVLNYSGATHSLSIRPVTIDDAALMSDYVMTRMKFRQLFNQEGTEKLKKHAQKSLSGPALERRLRELNDDINNAPGVRM
ncbi:MAG: hypothetical protein L6Q57_08080 [Alphaproteobacteria bacterium]|nr:hypothetical protein [Alphaproteobacteria bacterium]